MKDSRFSIQIPSPWKGEGKGEGKNTNHWNI
jgi:hypothetical protein